MESQVYLKSIRKILRYCSVLLLPVLTSCSLSAQTQEGQTMPQKVATQTVTEVESDFSEIQNALQQMNKNLLLKQSEEKMTQSRSTQDTENISDFTQKTPIASGSNTKMGMGMGKLMRSKMMSKKDDMGKMSKMMMGNGSMMGSKPKPDNQVMSVSSIGTLPGYKDVPHLYHLGEEDFFLNYQEKLNLSSDQISQLEVVKNKWEIFQSEKVLEREKLEEKLWQLTSSGIPDFNQIQKNISQVEVINTKLRMSFIKQVGNAVKVLHPKQALLLKEIEASVELN
tara:strand:+ start:588 stop:1433 length:846 start_codon:yes stop_codon:yes gene_type:complete